MPRATVKTRRKPDPVRPRGAAGIGAQRLAAQLVTDHRFAAPAEVVRWHGAMQAQDYHACLWAVGARMPATTAAAVERAIDTAAVIRTHAMRGTIQLIAADDVRWVLAAVSPRIDGALAYRMREFGLDARTVARAIDAVGRAVEGGRHRTRAELAATLAAARIDPGGGRLQHVLGAAEYARVLCSGGRRGKHATFAAFDERVPAGGEVDPLAARTELVRRYAQSRAPATLRDLAWWTGLNLAELRAAIAGTDGAVTLDGDQVRAAAPLPAARGGVPPRAHLLPAFDEYLIGYADRSAVLDPAHPFRGGGMLSPSIVLDGAVIGMWRRIAQRDAVSIEVTRFGTWSQRATAEVAAAARRYGAFLGLPARIVQAG
jgi:hypothetical protein